MAAMPSPTRGEGNATGAGEESDSWLDSSLLLIRLRVPPTLKEFGPVSAACRTLPNLI
jgi:hypothetical protein